MAEKKLEGGFVGRKSSEQRKVNEKAARTPAGAVDPSNAQVLTGHNVEADVVLDDEGNVVAAHTTDVVTDPESPLAVQVPDPDEHPNVNATGANALGSQAEASPNEVAAGDAEPDQSVGAGDEESARSGISNPADEPDDNPDE